MINRTILSAIVFVVAVAAIVLVALNDTGRTPPILACSAPVVVFITPHTYTADEAARRDNAAYGYTVGRPHYAPTVHGLVGGRYVTRD